MVIGGLDVGTTGCKIVLYDENAALIHADYREYATVHAGGRHEIHMEDIRAGVVELLRRAAKAYHMDALGVTSFGETFVMLDETDTVLAPSMLYTDPRGAEECVDLCAAVGEDKLTLLSGVRPHPMYSIAKLLWMKRHHSEVYARCRRILLGEDFIVYTLTGNPQMDYSLAARTGAFDIEKKAWIPQVLRAAGVDASLLSRPVPSGTIAGPIRPEIQKELGIDYTFTVVNGCHDQVAAMLGSGVFHTDCAMDGTGTVECMPVVLTKKPSDVDFYRCGYSVVPYVGNCYACYALSFTGGATLKWSRDNFAELEQREAQRQGGNVYAALDGRVGEQPSGILVLPHFAGAATPYMDADSKAAFVGITLETTKYDLYRALMEGTSYEMRLNFSRMRAQTGEIREIRASAGGDAISGKTYTQFHDALIDAEQAMRDNVKRAITVFAGLE